MNEHRRRPGRPSGRRRARNAASAAAAWSSEDDDEGQQLRRTRIGRDRRNRRGGGGGHKHKGRPSQHQRPSTNAGDPKRSGAGAGGRRRSKKEARAAAVRAAVDAPDAFDPAERPAAPPRIARTRHKKLAGAISAVFAGANADAPSDGPVADFADCDAGFDSDSDSDFDSRRARAPRPSSSNLRAERRPRSQKRGARRRRQTSSPLSSSSAPGDAFDVDANARGGPPGRKGRGARRPTSPRFQIRPPGRRTTTSPPTRRPPRRSGTFPAEEAVPPRSKDDLRTRRRRALEVRTLCFEDGSVECASPGLFDLDPAAVYARELSPRAGAPEEGARGGDDEEGGGGAEGRGEEDALGRNGWHRALRMLVPAPPNDADEGRGSGPRIRSSKSAGSCASEASVRSAWGTLDQLTATHVLTQVHPQRDELDAVREEHGRLLDEIASLEKDRVQLERRFHEAGRRAAEEERGRRTYRSFRSNLRYMKGEDARSLPVTWLEDVPLSMPDEKGDGGGKGRHRGLYAMLDKPFQDLIRDHRGVGLALLIADPQCKASLIGRCYANRRWAADKPRSAELSREKAATLIEDGGERLKHCAITGLGNAGTACCDGNDGDCSDVMGTTYFLKFDDGKTHHRGCLPANLVARLLREKREHGNIKYLSTGTSDSVQTERCYYAEFDDGECWWGTNKDDALDKTFMEIDVHRVAFGGSGSASSWIVLGKDGSVRWKNVPQGLHDALVGQDAVASAAPVGDAARGEDAVASLTGAARSPAAAPCEVSLGIGGTYFVRFLDGRVDYLLPNFAADVFDGFEADGKRIRDVALHVDTYDCLIRYSRERGRGVGNESDSSDNSDGR